MSISAVSATAAQPAWAKALEAPVGLPATSRGAPGRPTTPADVKRASSQFEAIILRQLLAPTIEPMMSGGIGGAQSTGGGVYGYLLTDVLANSLSQGGGLGLSQMLSRQLTARGEPLDTEATDASTGPVATVLP